MCLEIKLKLPYPKWNCLSPEEHFVSEVYFIFNYMRYTNQTYETNNTALSTRTNLIF